MRPGPLFLAAFVACASAAEQCPRTESRSYGGPLFDAMAQVESRMSSGVLGGMDRAGVGRLLEKYPDRFMFATDAHKDFRWLQYEAIVKQ